MCQLHCAVLYCAVILFSLLLNTASFSQGSANRVGPSERVYQFSYGAGEYFLSTDGGYYKSSDGAAWSKIHSRGMDGGSLVALPTGEIFLFTYDGYEKSTDGGTKWSSVSQQGFSTRTVIADSTGTLYAGQNDPVYVSHDKAATWIKTNPGASQNFFDVSILFLGPDSAIYAANQGITGGYAYRTTDQGASWKLLHAESMTDVTNLEVYPSGTIVLWYPTKIMRSVDGGKKWSTIADPKNVTYPSSAVFLNSTTGYALEQGRVVRTTNGGLDWDSTASFFDQEGFTRLFLGPNNALYAGATDGLYHLVEHAAVHGDESATSSLACYPNPASRELTVEAPASSELSLFDAVGRLVWSAKTGEITRASCPTAMLPCGSYLLVAQSGGSVQRQSVVVQH